MGLFGANYSKPGPGISKDEPQKKGVFRYFEVFFRKFWDLLKVNMLHFTVSIPFMLVMFALSPTDFFINLTYGTVNAESVFAAIVVRAVFAVMMFVLFGSGPSSAAYAYITRCFTRGEHAWVFSDFKDKFKENFKQGIIVSIADIIFVALIVVAYRVYLSQYISTGSMLWMVILALLSSMTFLFTIVHFYIYQFMATIRTGTIELYKNAFIFAVANMPMCIFLLAFAAILNYAIFILIPNPMLALLLDFIIGISLARFPIEYSASRAISKRLLSKSELEEEETEEQEFKGNATYIVNEGEE